jgi:hypothetical protein
MGFFLAMSVMTLEFLVLVPEKIRIQLMMSEEINKLLDDLARKELRTRSAIVELALLAYAAKLKDADFDPPA